MEWKRFNAAGTVGWQVGDGSFLALVLHGGPGLSEYTSDLCAEIRAGGDGTLRVARYQQRGAPPSLLEGPLTVAQLVEDALGVLDHLSADSAVIVGHSWGGHLAMHVAVAAPERVAGLLLLDSLGAVGDGGIRTMDPVIKGRMSAGAIEEAERLAARTDLSDDERATLHLRLLWPGYFKDPATAPPIDIRVHTAAGEVMGDAMGLLAEGVLERTLPTVDVPSLHLIGAHSPIEPDANLRTARLLRGAIVEVQDAGHFAWIEQPGSVEKATRRLLAEITRRRTAVEGLGIAARE